MSIALIGEITQENELSGDISEENALEGGVNDSYIVSPTEAQLKKAVDLYFEENPAPAGEKGDPGPPGERGDAGASAYDVAISTGYEGTEEEWLDSLKATDSHYTHNQETSADTWTVEHNLGKIPAVTVIDSAGTEVVGDVIHNNINTTTIVFTAAFSGKAYFN